MLNIQPGVGICYGETRTGFPRNHMKVVEQNFWYLISENSDLYTNIIVPIGFREREFNDQFATQNGMGINNFTASL